MIDPRKSPAPTLPILNAIAGHLIHRAAPLRVINIEDTQQMIDQAADWSGCDPECIDLALHHELPDNPAGESFAWQTEWLCNRPVRGYSHDVGIFISALTQQVAESV